MLENFIRVININFALASISRIKITCVVGEYIQLYQQGIPMLSELSASADSKY